MAGDDLGRSAEAVEAVQNIGVVGRMRREALLQQGPPRTPPQKLLVLQALPAPGTCCIKDRTGHCFDSGRALKQILMRPKIPEEGWNMAVPAEIEEKGAPRKRFLGAEGPERAPAETAGQFLMDDRRRPQPCRHYH